MARKRVYMRKTKKYHHQSEVLRKFWRKRKNEQEQNSHSAVEHDFTPTLSLDNSDITNALDSSIVSDEEYCDTHNVRNNSLIDDNLILSDNSESEINISNYNINVPNDSEVEENEELAFVCEQENVHSSSEDITGRRIVNIMYFMRALKSLRHDGFGCSFFDMNVIAEKRLGFESVISMKCAMCNGSKEEPNRVQEYRESGAFPDIEAALKRPADHANSLIQDFDNNMAELYNSHVAKFVGGKRINYSLRGSYQTRCEAAVLANNCDGQLLSKIHHAYMGNAPGYYTQNYCKSEERRIKTRREKRKIHVGRNKRRQPLQGEDREYGEYAAEERPDLSEEKMKTACDNFILNLRRTDSVLLEENTRSQFRSALWRKERLKRLTASTFGKIYKMRKTTSTANTVNSLLYSDFSGNKATQYGVRNESNAICIFEAMFKKKVVSCGMFVHPTIPYFAATPDGLVEENAIIEIKCPYSIRNSTIADSVLQKKITWCKIVNGKLELNINHAYMCQIQGQLEITGRDLCYFIVYTPNETCVQIIQRDRKFWENMEDKLKMFYLKCLLPELVDPRKSRGLKVRNIFLS